MVNPLVTGSVNQKMIENEIDFMNTQDEVSEKLKLANEKS